MIKYVSDGAGWNAYLFNLAENYSTVNLSRDEDSDEDSDITTSVIFDAFAGEVA
jgi:NRPS condensation-like uncharacterized protein